MYEIGRSSCMGFWSNIKQHGHISPSPTEIRFLDGLYNYAQPYKYKYIFRYVHIISMMFFPKGRYTSTQTQALMAAPVVCAEQKHETIWRRRNMGSYFKVSNN